MPRYRRRPHAAGVVIADRPLVELVPLYRDPRSEMPATQYNMKWVVPAGSGFAVNVRLWLQTEVSAMPPKLLLSPQ